MSTATITSKGQVTLPKDMRRKLHLEAGEKIDFRVDEETGTATLVPLNKRVEDVFGLMHRPKRNKPVTIEEMGVALKKKFRREYS
jgi:AbrB family looped-hinge helix DNA binding protein